MNPGGASIPDYLIEDGLVFREPAYVKNRMLFLFRQRCKETWNKSRFVLWHLRQNAWISDE